MAEETRWLTKALSSREPLQPLPINDDDRRSIERFGTLPNLASLLDDGIRVVLLDVYGTLVISGSGDVGTADDSSHDAADRWIIDSAKDAGLDDLTSLPTAEQLRREIVATNEAARSVANPKPEVDILQIWRRVLKANGRDDLAADSRQLVRIVCGVEGRSNPTWPMPGATAAIAAMNDRGIRLGIVSNAQFYTPLIVDALLGSELASTLDRNACHFSSRYRAAKPGPLLFESATRHLDGLGVARQKVLYIGNDMLNDIWAAKQFGLRTALFAGDARSLRLRSNEARCQNCVPDAVIHHWQKTNT